MPRQNLNPPVALIPPPPSKSRRNRTWEKDNPTASYRLPVELRDAITSLAQDHLVTTSELVRYLLQYALDQHQSGNLAIQPQLSTGRYTLFQEK